MSSLVVRALPRRPTSLTAIQHDPDVYIFVLGKVMTEEYVDTGLDVREELKDIVELYDPTCARLQTSLATFLMLIIFKG